jgi:hypothetical protein
VQTLVWFHCAGISFFTILTLGLVVWPLVHSKPMEPKATLTPAKGLVLLIFYFALVAAYLLVRRWLASATSAVVQLLTDQCGAGVSDRRCDAAATRCAARAGGAGSDARHRLWYVQCPFLP